MNKRIPDPVEVFSTNRKAEFNKVLHLLEQEKIAVDLEVDPARTSIIGAYGRERVPAPFFICVAAADEDRARAAVERYLQALPQPAQTPGNDLITIIILLIGGGTLYAIYIGLRQLFGSN
jgi:hypothetical protein